MVKKNQGSNQSKVKTKSKRLNANSPRITKDFQNKSCSKKSKIPTDLKSKKSRMEYLLKKAGKAWEKVSCPYALECCKLPATKKNKKYWYETKSRFGQSCYKFKGELKRLKPDAHNWNESSYFLSAKFRAKNTKKALKSGWTATLAKNRMIIYHDPDNLGWIKWFETGSCMAHVKKPVNEGKKLQLVANAFFNTELISDIKFFTKFYQSFYIKQAKFSYKLGIRLPPFKLEFNNGLCRLTVKSDRSHPKSIEIEYMLTKEAEQMKGSFKENTEALKQDTKAFLQLTEIMKQLLSPKASKPDPSKMVV